MTQPQPAHEAGEVFAVHRAGPYTELTVIAPGITTGFRPGQFVSVAVGGDCGLPAATVLRRPYGLSGVTPSDVYAGTIRFVVAERGPGSRWLAARTAGEHLDLIGPLGTPFPLPAQPGVALLVGAAYRTALLLPLAEALVAGDSEVAFLLGARSGAQLFGELAAKRTAGQVTIVTDDGSAGSPGRISDALPGELERSCAEIVYASGPRALLRAVGETAVQRDVRAHVLYEEAMACGIGVCGTCAVPVRDGVARCCVDGPVFDAAQVRWDATGVAAAEAAGRR